MKRFLLVRVVFLICLILVAHEAAPAQSTRIVGRVVDRSTQQVLANAHVHVRGLGMSFQTELVAAANGSFTRAVTAGRYELTTTHAGFATRVDTLEVREGLETGITVVLDAAPLSVDTVEAKAAAARPYLAGFWERRDRKLGYYLTREDIEKKKPLRLTDLFRTIPGAKVMPGPNGLGQFVSFGRVRSLNGQLCQAAVYLDGRPFKMTPVGLDDFFPDMVEAIEAYAGSSRLPPQFNATGTPAGNPQCGVIVIWTRTSTDSR